MADLEGVPWNPSLEGIPSKILCAIVVRSNCSYALQLHSSNSARVSTPSPRFSRREPGDEANGLCARIYYQKHVATIETMSEASERIKARVIFMHAPYAARDGDMLSVCERLFSNATMYREAGAHRRVYFNRSH